MRFLIFYGVIGLTACLLIYYAASTEDRSRAIVAEVEPQKTAISFHKPVRIAKVLVQPGQRVKKGDLLLVAQRPDLALDLLQVQNQIEQIQSLRTSQQSDYQLRKDLAQLKLEEDLHSLALQESRLREKYRADSVVYAQLKPGDTNWGAAAKERLQALEAEIAIRQSQYEAELKRWGAELEQQLSSADLLIQRRQQELAVLEDEVEQLSQYAPFDGTIGSINVQLQELVPAFRTIISVYYEKPALIRAFMSELDDKPVEVGQSVRVESVNRTYEIQGEVAEVGSRIVSYPRQMNPLQQQPMWGKEIFIKIPQDNNFLNGEKVFVILNR
ncbi:MAG: HlyD family efflux transporter periplasmic adaptor subunit [Bacteroidota bacterium]